MDIIKTSIDFKKIFDEIGDITKRDMRSIMQELAMDAFDSVMSESATDTGYLRNNWQIVVDETPEEGKRSQPKGAKKGQYKDAKRSSVAKVRHDSIVVVYNNTEYAIYLEEGTPANRAQPMIRPTEQMLRKTAEKLALDLTKKGYNI